MLKHVETSRSDESNDLKIFGPSATKKAIVVKQKRPEKVPVTSNRQLNIDSALDNDLSQNSPKSSQMENPVAGMHIDRLIVNSDSHITFHGKKREAIPLK